MKPEKNTSHPQSEMQLEFKGQIEQLGLFPLPSFPLEKWTHIAKENDRICHGGNAAEDRGLVLT